MPLRPVTDTSPADWFVDSDAPWHVKVGLGPPGFEAYARVFFDIDDDGGMDISGEAHLLSEVRDILARHTTTPDNAYFGLWDGNGEIEATYSWIEEDGRATGPQPPPGVESTLVSEAAFPGSVLDGPKVRVPARDYYLFTGPLDDAGNWGAADYPGGRERGPMDGPHLMWPADHAWFLAADVDPDWFGIGGSQTLIDEILADSRFVSEVVAYGPSQEWIDWENRR